MLNLGIDGQVHIVALARGGFPYHLLNHTSCVCYQNTLTMVAGKQRIVSLLDAAFAYSITRLDITALGSVLQVIFGSGARITQGMRRHRPIGIGSRGSNLRADTRKGITMFGNIRDIAQLHIACHHSLALGARRRIENTRTHHFVGNSQKGRKAQDHIGVLCNIRIGKNSLHLAVCNHGNTICIVDNATRSRRIYRSVEVRICLFAIAGSLNDLQTKQLSGKRTENTQCYDANRSEAIAQALARSNTAAHRGAARCGAMRGLWRFCSNTNRRYRAHSHTVGSPRVGRIGAHTEHNCKDNAQYNKSGKSSENSGKHVFPLPLAESTRGRNLPRFIRSLSKRQATHDDKEQRRDQ